MNSPLSTENDTKPDPVRDSRGWISLDHRLPANLEMCLVWNDDEKSVQFAEFRMYSSTRYEFMQGSHVLSIHHVTHWQSEPNPPDADFWGTV